ncbi:MAG: hypothetical protein AB8C40_09795 [Gammaproteobacteria bacterium]
MKYIFVAIISIVFCSQASAWQGYNMDTGAVILLDVADNKNITTGNVAYFDYDSGSEKIGYLNMYEQNIGLLIDLDSGELIRVKMEGRQ